MLAFGETKSHLCHFLRRCGADSEAKNRQHRLDTLAAAQNSKSGHSDACMASTSSVVQVRSSTRASVKPAAASITSGSKTIREMVFLHAPESARNENYIFRHS